MLLLIALGLCIYNYSRKAQWAALKPIKLLTHIPFDTKFCLCVTFPPLWKLKEFERKFKKLVILVEPCTCEIQTACILPSNDLYNTSKKTEKKVWIL